MTRTRRVAVLLISIALLGLVFYATCIALQKAVANRQQERTGTFMGSDSRTSASMPVVYVASPLGFSAATRKFMNDQLIPSIGKAGVRPVNPWDASEEVQKKIEE